MSIRNQDNYQDSLQYIRDQLYIYNYLDAEDFNTLKMKLWALDGPIRQEELVENPETGELETPDKDVSTPWNHWETLLNDLTYLDKYIRTEDDLLEEREDDFYIFWEDRIEQKIRFVNTIKDEETGETYKDWEQTYNQRPTLLTQDDFEELYQLFKSKEELGEWEKAIDIVGKVVKYCIDIEAYRAEQAVLTHIPPDEMESQLKVKANENVEENDRNYVVEMQKLHDELLDIVISTMTEEEGEEIDEETGDPVTISPDYLINLPTRREIVSIDNNSTHKGTIIEELQEGGYRFVYRSTSGDSVPPPSVMPYDDGGAWNKFNQLENNWNDVTWARVEEIERGETVEYELVSMGQVTGALSSVPGSEFTIGENSIERYNTLNKRWININNLREYKISNTGTRVIIESMVNAEIPEMLDDKEKHFTDKKNQKEFYTDTLKERLEEFI